MVWAVVLILRKYIHIYMAVVAFALRTFKTFQYVATEKCIRTTLYLISEAKLIIFLWTEIPEGKNKVCALEHLRI